MRMHVVQHVPFEGPELIAEWAAERGFDVTAALALTEEFPPLDEVDLLLVMGGPMSADDHGASPWLLAEKRYLAQALAGSCRMLGVCLGAQIVAEVAGGEVRRNRHPEIGYYPVHHTGATVADPVLSAFPDGLVVGHWHGDTFEMPPGVAPALSSDATPNQAFSLDGGRVVALQFHLEWTRDALEALVDASGEDLAADGPAVSSASDLLEGVERRGPACREALWALLDRMMLVGEEGR